MLKLASEAGDLIVTETTWEVTDKTHFVSQRTIDSAKSAEANQILQDSADFAEKDATLYRTDTVTDTSTFFKEETNQLQGDPEKPKKKTRDPSRTWRMVAEEWSALDPEKSESIGKWCRYKAQVKDKPFIPETILLKHKAYSAWTPLRFAEAVEHSIQKPYRDVFDHPKNDPERKKVPGQNATPQPKLTLEEARRINSGDLPDLGSPVSNFAPKEAAQ
jgi:hypothetical protein